MRTHTMLLGLVALALAAAACGDQFSTQEAYATCEDQLGRASQDTDDAIFAECVACYEDCGSDCTMTGDAPLTFVCPID
jgi:hypothetical protein